MKPTEEEEGRYICEQLLVDGNEENTHPNNNNVFENNLANEEHIVKKSKTHHYKLNPRMRRTEEKIKPLAKQIGPF